MNEVRAPNYELAEIDYMDGMKYKDIAKKYDVTLNTVKSWKTRYKWSRDNKRGVHTKDKKVRTQNQEDISWVQIEKEYVTDIRKSPYTLEELAEKYNVSVQTMKNQSMNNEWSRKRTEYKQKVNQKAIERASDKDANRISKLLRITDIATDKAEQALSELEIFIVKNKKKTKVIEYNDSKAVGKPTKEIIEEVEALETVQGPVDRQGLLFVTNTIKNIKDVYSLDNGLGSDEDTGIKEFLKAIRPSEEDLKELFADEEVIEDGEETTEE